MCLHMHVLMTVWTCVLRLHYLTNTYSSVQEGARNTKDLQDVEAAKESTMLGLQKQAIVCTL